MVLPAADRPLPAPRQRRIGGAAGIAQQRQHVVAVENREARLQADRLAVLAQQAHAQRVEGADHQRPGGTRADHLAGALAHLGRRLVGERDGGDLLGRRTGVQQVRDLVHDDARLARARAGQHQARPLGVPHGLPLRWIEGGRGRLVHRRRAMIANGLARAMWYEARRIRHAADFTMHDESFSLSRRRWLAQLGAAVAAPAFVRHARAADVAALCIGRGLGSAA